MHSICLQSWVCNPDHVPPSLWLDESLASNSHLVSLHHNSKDLNNSSHAPHMNTATVRVSVFFMCSCILPIRSIDSIGLQLWKAPSLGLHWCVFSPGNSIVFSYSQHDVYSGNVQFSCSCTMREYTCDIKGIGGLLVNPGGPGFCISRSFSTRGHHDRQVLTSWVERMPAERSCRNYWWFSGTSSSWKISRCSPFLYEVIFIMQQERGQTVLPWHNYTAAHQAYADTYR